MRQRADKLPEERFLEAIGDMVSEVADSTKVNGFPYWDRADWMEATPNRAQMFVKPDEVGLPTYDVTFAGGKVLGAPWNLKYDSELCWGPAGWTFVVRRISPDTQNDTMIDVTVLAVLVSRGA